MNEFASVPVFLKRAAQQNGFDRERYTEADVPDDFSQIVIMPFFGDYRAETVLSSILLHNYIKKYWSKKYFILCSWQGHAGLFPYVNEFWSLGDQITLKGLNESAVNFNNEDARFQNIAKNLRKYFDNVLTWEDMNGYYDNGLTRRFFENFGEDTVSCFMPGLPSPRIELSKELIQRNRPAIFIHPVRMMRTWNKRDINVNIKQDFWKVLTNKLIDNGYLPVVYQSYSTYDISSDFGDKCIYITDNNILSLMSAMRACGCVLDVYSGISRIAMMARCPFLVMDERGRYVNSKEYEINDLCISGAYPYRYILSFCAILEGGNNKDTSDHLISVLSSFTADLNKSKLVSSSESYTDTPYNIVRNHKEKKLGIRFIKVERLLI